MTPEIQPAAAESGGQPGVRRPESWTPKLLTVIREGYGRAQLRADAIAGLTVAIVALPLAMALGVASGASSRTL